MFNLCICKTANSSIKIFQWKIKFVKRFKIIHLARALIAFVLKTNLFEISLEKSCVNGALTSVDDTRHSVETARSRECVLCTNDTGSTSARNAIAVHADTGRERHVRDISDDTTILRRGYPRCIVRAIDGSSIGARRGEGGGVSGWVHPPHYATHSTRANARASVPRTYNSNTDYWTREGWARVRCNKGDNGHYDRRVTSLETTNPLAR